MNQNKTSWCNERKHVDIESSNKCSDGCDHKDTDLEASQNVTIDHNHILVFESNPKPASFYHPDQPLIMSLLQKAPFLVQLMFGLTK